VRFFFFNDTATTEIYPLSLHDALPICFFLRRVKIARGDPSATRLRPGLRLDRKSTRLNSSHVKISYAVFCLKKKQGLRELLLVGSPADCNWPALGRLDGPPLPVRATDTPPGLRDANFKLFFFFNDTATTEIYPLSLHDALPIFQQIFQPSIPGPAITIRQTMDLARRSEEHTSELQSRENLVCRLLLEKKKK